MIRGKVKDLYKILGVRRDATNADIKTAFRTLAKRYHPDRNPGDGRAVERFKEVQAAYAVLSNPEKKPKYDRKLRIYEAIANARGQTTTTPRGTRYRQRSDGTYVRQSAPNTRTNGWLSWLFGDAERTRHLNVTLSFEKAFRGGATAINGALDKPIRVTLPEGIRDGYTIRIKNVEGPPLQVTFKVRPHVAFKMRGDDLVLTRVLKIGVMEAMLGGTYQVSHPGGTPVAVQIPPGTQPGATIRVRGKGLRNGDMIITVKVVIPRDLTAPQRELLRHAAEAAGLRL